MVVLCNINYLNMVRASMNVYHDGYMFVHFKELSDDYATVLVSERSES